MDTGATDDTIHVFVSYAREDTDFRNELVAALADLPDLKVEAWVDEEDIPKSAKWMGEINHGIENTDALIAVVTPDSADSDICGEEVRHAAQAGKPILPIVRRESTKNHDEIAERNWIFWQNDQQRTNALTDIRDALQIDTDWAKEHQSLLNDALDWDRHDRDRNRLARGEALAKAEASLTIVRNPRQPQATTLMREFVRASRTDTTRRQRRTATTAIAVAVVSLALAGLAFWQFQRANAERERAEEQLALASSRALAAQAIQLQRFDNEDIGLLLAAESAARAPTAEARDALLGLLPDGAIDSLRSAERPDAAIDRIVSPDGRFEVSNEGRRLRDLETGEEQTLLDDDRDLAIFLRDATFSPDSSRLVLTNLTQFRFEAYDLSAGLPAPLLFTVGPPAGQVIGAVFDQSNELIGVTVDDDEVELTMWIWDEVGTEVLVAAVEETLDEDFTLNEALVRVGVDDSELGALVTKWGEAQLFSSRSGQLIGFLLPTECSPECASDENARLTNAFQTSETLETIDLEGTARSWDLSLDRWIALACESSDGSLTEEQWERFVGADVDYDPVC